MYDSIRARGMLSTAMSPLPVVDLTLQVEFQILDTLTPVWSHSQTTKPRILAMYQLHHLPIWVGKVDSIPPNPKLKSILRTFGEVFSIRKRFFHLEDASLACWSRPGERHGLVREVKHFYE